MEKQAKRQQERAKNRSETNKSPDPERTKAPTQTPERTQNRSELRTQSELRPRSELRANPEPERTQNSEFRAKKKRGVKTPQKIYASFCEMKPIVLKNPTPSFCGLYVIYGISLYTIRKKRGKQKKLCKLYTNPTSNHAFR